MNYSATTFDPRIATAQAIFAVIYILLTLIALALGFYARAEALSAGDAETQPWVEYFMALLFALLAVKSFWIVHRTRSLLRHGRRVAATVLGIERSRGISIIRAQADAGDGQLIAFETRYAGEHVARELETYLTQRHTEQVPALLVGQGRYSRGMLALRSSGGHLDLQSLSSESETGIADPASAADTPIQDREHS